MTRVRVMLLAVVLVALPLRPSAHDIPSDVRIQALLKPEGQRLRLVVRAPIAAMNELEWPSQGVLLDLARVEPVLQEAATKWVASRIDLYEEDRRLPPPVVAAARVSLPADTSFDSYEGALAHVLGPPLADDTEVVTAQALMDVLLEYPIRADTSRLSIETRFETTGLRSTTVLRFQTAAGVERAFQFHGDPGLVRLDPRWLQAAWRFVVDGFFHIIDGTDHLLFLLCLVIPFRRIGGLVPVVTAFTVAHSITLIASAYGMAPDVLWFPPLVETLIALSIVYMALENIVAPQLDRRWMIAFAFGLVHGFGFSFALRDSLQFAGNHLLTSLLSFNVGVEAGQLVVLVLLVPAIAALFRFVVAERMGTIILSALVAHTGWHWMIDRGQSLLLYQFQRPAFDAAFFALLLRWLMLAVAVVGLGWLATVIAAAGRRAGRRPSARIGL